MSRKKLYFDAEKYFSALDKNENGQLDKHEIKQALKKVGIPTSPALIKNIMTNIDLDLDG